MLTLRDFTPATARARCCSGSIIEVRRGEVVTLLGRNGMGKTTTIRSIMGMTPPHGGTITFEGRELRGLTSFRIAKLGLGLVPEGRCIFPSLTVWENLTATSAAGPSGQATLDHRRDRRTVPLDPRAQDIRWAASSPAASSRCWRSRAHS